MSERVVPLTVEAADILPIIKRFLYTEREIFLRELISNAIDALTKLDASRLNNPVISDDGEPLCVKVSVDPVSKTVSIADNGIGMSSDEVVRYINQIAFSSAKEFIDQQATSEVSLIGQFGLGFYSSFMVSTQVEIETRSWRVGERACRWTCDGGTSTRVEEFELTRRGTRVTCQLEDNAHEFLELERIEKVIYRFLDYAPYPIFLEGRQVNTVTAPWHLGRNEREDLPSQCYWDNYERLNPNENHPLGWFHIESDFPVPVRALFFVPDRPNGGAGNLRLFENRTFICDHCSELIADWLGFVEGIVDCQDLPLNVARDRFQKDKQVVQLRKHITAKTVDFLTRMMETRRKDYVHFWEQFGRYLKRGYLIASMNEQQPLSAKLEKLMLFPSSRKPMSTIDEYLQRIPDSTQPIIFYLTDPQAQQSHLELLRSRNREVLYFTDHSDAVLVQVLGQARPELSFTRVDQIEAIENLQPGTGLPRSEATPHGEILQVIDWDPLLDLFREITDDVINRVSVAKLPSRDIPAVLSRTQQGVRDDVFSLFKDTGSSVEKGQLVINTACPLIQSLGRLGAGIRTARLPMELVGRIWDNVQLSAGLLEGQSLADAVRRSQKFLDLVAEKLINAKE
jgi:molecular chaperone HtpG